MTLAPSPLYSDPVHLAPTDPAVIAAPDANVFRLGEFYFTHRTFATLNEHRVDNVVDPQRLTDIHSP